MRIFGDILKENEDDLNFEEIKKIINRPFIAPRYRVSILNPDESVNYIIPDEDITVDGIAYTEEYQNGQRRNITLKLVNIEGKYTPDINGIWLNTKFSFEIGIVVKNKIIWFPKGIYIVGDVSLEYSDSDRIITIQLKDKFAMFEGKTGTLEDPYEIEVESNIEEALQGIMNFSMENGQILDYKPIILDPSFIGKKTQQTIRIEEGRNLGEIIKSIAIQLSAEYYYNNMGNLCFYPINETVDDSNKPIIWTFTELNEEMSKLSLSYKNEEVINVVKVVGDNIDKGLHSSVVENTNPSSPICIQRIGRRAAPKRSEPNIWNDDLAEDLAKYYLRQASFISVDFSSEVGFNPILAVNNVCEVENSFLQLKREKFLITSISFNSKDGLMSLKLCNTKELPAYKNEGKINER